MAQYKHPLLGEITFRILGGAGGPIEVTSPNLPIVDVVVPQLKNVPLYELGGQKFGGKIRWHKRGVAQLLAAWADVEKAGLLDRVLTFDGALNPRLIRGSHSTPSNHAFATAFDINAEWNGLHVPPPPIGRKGSVRALAPIFEKHGFRWGGSYQSRPDGMHFEIVRWLDEDLPDVDEIKTAHVVLNGVHKEIPAILRSENDGTLYVGLRGWCSSFPGTSFDDLTITQGKLSAKVVGPAYADGARQKNVEGLVIDGVGYVRFIDLFGLYLGLSKVWDGPTRELRLSSGRANP